MKSHALQQYSWSSNFAVNVLEDDPAKIESANFILLVKLGSRAAIGYYPLRERGAANIRIREYQYREYRGPTVYDRNILLILKANFFKSFHPFAHDLD